MIYIPYCKNKPTSDKARAEHDKFFLQRQSELGHRLGIDDLLIAPVQRFTKYQLLLRVSLGKYRSGPPGCLGNEHGNLQETFQISGLVFFLLGE